jgi:hypothetical protein
LQRVVVCSARSIAPGIANFETFAAPLRTIPDLAPAVANALADPSGCQ